MRGARGIEFGVDIPAIPSLGLGSLPLASSLSNIRRLTSNDATAASKHAQGDGWGFRDWTRFVGAWSQDQIDTAERKHTSTQDEIDRKANDAIASAASSVQLETKVEKRKREQAADDHVVKSTTDTLSAVFDWLIERVPTAPKVTLTASPSSSLPDDKHVREAVKDSAGEPSKKQDEKEGEGAVSKAAAEAMHFAKATQELKDLSAAAVTHAMGLGATTGGSPAHAGDAPPSEMKKRMDREDKSRKRAKELARKEDLERFYIALSRKMYDEGL
jgi:triacylglycerol lipase